MAVNSYRRSYSEYAALLGVKGGETRAEVRALYKAAITKFHPDQNNQAGWATDMSALTNEAWNFFDKKYFREEENTTAKPPGSSGSGPTGSNRTNATNGNGSTSSNTSSNSNSNTSSNTSGGTSNNNTRRGHTNSNTGSQRTSGSGPTGSNRTNATNGNGSTSSNTNTNGGTSNSNTRRDHTNGSSAGGNGGGGNGPRTDQTAPQNEDEPAQTKAKKKAEKSINLFKWTAVTAALFAAIWYQFYPLARQQEDADKDADEKKTVRTLRDKQTKQTSNSILKEMTLNEGRSLSLALLEINGRIYESSPYKGMGENSLRSDLKGARPYYQSTKIPFDVKVLDRGKDKVIGGKYPDKSATYFSVIPTELTPEQKEAFKKEGVAFDDKTKIYTIRGAVTNVTKFANSPEDTGVRYATDDAKMEQNIMAYQAKCYDVDVSTFTLVNTAGTRYILNPDGKLVTSVKTDQTVEQKAEVKNAPKPAESKSDKKPVEPKGQKSKGDYAQLKTGSLATAQTASPSEGEPSRSAGWNRISGAFSQFKI